MSKRTAGWTCFHCGEHFRPSQKAEAAEHFGASIDQQPLCRIKAEEGSLAAALREADALIGKLRREAENAEHAAELASGSRSELMRRLVPKYRPGMTIEAIIDLYHGSNASHGAFPVGCQQWPCTLIPAQGHRFTASTDEGYRDTCILCGEAHSHDNHIERREA